MSVRRLSIAGRPQAPDLMAGYPGYHEQRWYSGALATDHAQEGPLTATRSR